MLVYDANQGGGTSDERLCNARSTADHHHHDKVHSVAMVKDTTRLSRANNVSDLPSPRGIQTGKGLPINIR